MSLCGISLFQIYARVYTGLAAYKPLKVEQGARPIFWQTETNQNTPTATCATSSSAILATMLDVL